MTNQINVNFIENLLSFKQFIDNNYIVKSKTKGTDETKITLIKNDDEKTFFIKNEYVNKVLKQYYEQQALIEEIKENFINKGIVLTNFKLEDTEALIYLSNNETFTINNIYFTGVYNLFLKS